MWLHYYFDIKQTFHRWKGLNQDLQSEGRITIINASITLFKQNIY